jgi:hypothetical protein
MVRLRSLVVSLVLPLCLWARGSGGQQGGAHLAGWGIPTSLEMSVAVCDASDYRPW